ncbi:MAG: FHA domain-containing protein [Planctomycetes bacterium]|nr:FHA domain-containing protein [Planctomycetota bacterium]
MSQGGRIRVVVSVNGRDDETYVVDRDRFTVGRDARENFIVLPNLGVSRKHAEIERQGNSWRIVDLESANGIRVNGAAVTEAVLRDGDVVAIGPHHTLRFVEERVEGGKAFESTVRIDPGPKK